MITISYNEMSKSQLIGVIETQRARLREIEETHKHELRELQWHDDMMSNSHLPIAARYAARAVRKFQQERKPLDDGYYKAYLPAMAKLSGVSASTISRGLQVLSDATTCLDKLNEEIKDERGHVEKQVLYFRTHDGFESARTIEPIKDIPKHGGNRRLPCPECKCVHRRVKRREECAECGHKFYENERIIRGDEEPLQLETVDSSVDGLSNEESVTNSLHVDKPLQLETVEASNESEENSDSSESLQLETLTVDTRGIYSIASCNGAAASSAITMVMASTEKMSIASCNGFTIPPKPITPFIDNPLALPELKDRRIWVCWRWEWAWNKDKTGGRWTKVPYVANLEGRQKASVNNLAHGYLYRWALACYTQSQSWDTDGKLPFDGVGFLCDGTFTFVDWDKCCDTETGEIAADVLEQARAINSYTEPSVSGHGRHAYAWGNIQENRKDEARGVEMYDNNRFCVFTGMPLSDFPSTMQQRGDELKALHSALFVPKPKRDDLAGPLWDSGDEPGSDEEIDAILSKAMRAANSAKFRLLFSGQWQQVRKPNDDSKQYYPSQHEADQALCEMFVYWGARRVSTIDRLFRQSGLMRDKWLREDYRTETIKNALHMALC